ncbi:MAG TPA: hypothetical protein VFF40_06810 [Acidimicrobiia bacterium]|nr:hypothetical protein [Acidimicrobiia bacterium]
MSPPPLRDPTWHGADEAVRVAFRRTTLRRTLVIAFIVGTLLSIVNRADVIARGDAGTMTWMRIAVN